MANELIPFPSGTKTGSNSIFTRERLIARAANLRYEIEIISIITPLPPARKPKQPVLARSAALSNKRKQARCPYHRRNLRSISSPQVLVLLGEREIRAECTRWRHGCSVDLRAA